MAKFNIFLQGKYKVCKAGLALRNLVPKQCHSFKGSVQATKSNFKLYKFYMTIP